MGISMAIYVGESSFSKLEKATEHTKSMLNSWAVMSDETAIKQTHFDPMMPNTSTLRDRMNLREGPSREDYVKYNWLFNSRR
jgi:hypothetical protein